MARKFYTKNFLDPAEDLLKNVELRGTNVVAGGPIATKTIGEYSPIQQAKDVQNLGGQTVAGNMQDGPLQSRVPFQEDMLHTYSGTDVTVAIVYNEHILLLNNVETFAWSIHREKVPVRRLGDTNAKNYTYGSRTIAGSIVFVQFDEHPLYGLFQFLNERTAKNTRYSSPLSDDIPPFDIILYFSNEAGAGSIMRFYAIDIADEGGVVSINDIYSENTMQWVCKDMDPMISEGEVGSWKALLFQKQLEGKVVDEQFTAMLRYRQKLENDVSRLSAEIQTIDKQIIELGTRNTDVNGIGTMARTNMVNSDPGITQRRNALTKQANIKQSKIDRLVAEISKVDASIAAYEQSNMTWDMDANLYGMTRSERYIKPYTTNNVDGTIAPGYQPYGDYDDIVTNKPEDESPLQYQGGAKGSNPPYYKKGGYKPRPYVDQRRPPRRGDQRYPSQ